MTLILLVFSGTGEFEENNDIFSINRIFQLLTVNIAVDFPVKRSD
ncbi:hypothetical protein [Paenibacillus sp. LjRoot56]